MDDIFSPYLTLEDVVALVKRQVNIFGGIRSCARTFGVHPADISLLLSGKRGPSQKLLEKFGYEKVVYYVRKG